MTEHGWPGPDDHHDHHDDDGYPDADPAADPLVPDAGLPFDDLPGDDVWDVPEPDLPAAPPDLPGGPPEPEVPAAYGGDPAAVAPVVEPVGADPDAAAEPDTAAEVFPPVLDVGPLPEPVDGFPWIDTGSLGVADPGAVPAGAAAPTPQDLAGYAATDLPPGVDPWAALEASDDPATAALARFYRPGDTSPDS